jgi:hypothetical protein
MIYMSHDHITYEDLELDFKRAQAVNNKNTFIENMKVTSRN